MTKCHEDGWRQQSLVIFFAFAIKSLLTLFTVLWGGRSLAHSIYVCIAKDNRAIICVLGSANRLQLPVPLCYNIISRQHSCKSSIIIDNHKYFLLFLQIFIFVQIFFLNYCEIKIISYFIICHNLLSILYNNFE